MPLTALVALIACPAPEEDTGDGITNPCLLDDDNDGASNCEEEQAGTDPNNPDTDGDGKTDGEELADGTNPLYEYSRSFIGGWNVGNCEAGEPTPTGPTAQGQEPGGQAHPLYQAGDIAYNFTFLDQNDEAVSLYSFCGHQTMLVFFPYNYFATPTREDEQDIMMNLRFDQQKYEGYGFQIIVIITKDYQGGQPDTEDARQLSATIQSNEIYMPVLVLPPEEQSLQSTLAWYEADWDYPTIVHIGPDGAIISMDQGITNPCETIEGCTE